MRFLYWMEHGGNDQWKGGVREWLLFMCPLHTLSWGYVPTFVSRWGQRFPRTGKVDKGPDDGRGGAPKLPDSMLEESYEKLLDGCWVARKVSLPMGMRRSIYDHPPAHGGRTGAAVVERPRARARGSLSFVCQQPRPAHAVIDRVHARLQEQFVRWFCGYDRRQRPSIQYKAVIQELFYNNAQVASPGVIAADVRGLPELYNKVIELDGLRAPRPWC